ncbi:MAG TPA: FIST N-terminal domain-containing protein, partial [Mucilaginibacter sp.]|nr:FIST N-terminal domain-containing protein [Mucilaginibacter sp.]
MKARSIRGNSAEEIQSELAKNMADGFKPTLAIVFISVKQDRNAVCRILDDIGISVFGVTTHGEFIDEDLGNGTIAMLLLDISPAYFTILFDEFSGKNYREVAQAMAEKAKEKFANPAFLIAGSGMETDAEALLAGFEDIIGNQVDVFGCLGGDDFTFKEQFVFTTHKESSAGTVAIVLDEDKVIVKGRATCGWKAVGTPKTVTKSEGNHVFEVDNVPVLELTRKYSGLEIRSRDTVEVAIQIATSLPLQLQREKGDPIMRPGIRVNFDDGSFICSGTVPQGSMVRFSLPPDFDVMETVIKVLEELKATEMPEADALIVFSCAGRVLSFGPMMTIEIEGIRKVW